MSAPDLQNNSKPEGIGAKIKNMRFGAPQLLVLGIIFWLLLTCLALSLDM
ncbi:MAG: hypothetical protein R3Y11_06410 [Pseudomonadota bacterium]